ncbi:hypothetical protein [Streptomyces lavenduligriseus]|uniref:Uncharacterized protein n=1 Tax=Streptomyces lavenduligriseus TaxID=67315 RepID=A0ABT0NL64_9ACTN|nr:hypothetical protein [Streptomyces lavenduligriseus]MCL3992091.1 hypothetical protein [Streptomyces lavenduligriseus]
MTDPMTAPIEVYRLVPRFHDDFRGALLESDEIMRWELDEARSSAPELTGKIRRRRCSTSTGCRWMSPRTGCPGTGRTCTGTPGRRV